MIDEPRTVELRVFKDRRGAVLPLTFDSCSPGKTFVQQNFSQSKCGVIRGLHYQVPKPQGKLVVILEGEIRDAVLDMREDSPTYLSVKTFDLTPDKELAIWVPPGFAHGFSTRSEYSLVSYLLDEIYDPHGQFSINPLDPELNIDWGVSHPQLSDKDRCAPLLKEWKETQ